MKYIERVFHLHPLTTEDCIHFDTGNDLLMCLPGVVGEKWVFAK